MLSSSLWRVCVAVCGFVLLAGACGTVVAEMPGEPTPTTGGEAVSTALDGAEQSSVLPAQTRQQNDTEQSGKPPRAEAGLDRQVPENQSVPLDAGGSSARTGEIVAYEWEIDPPENTTAEPDCSRCRNTTFVPREPGIYAVTVTVTDSGGRQRSDTLYVSVGERDPPAASLRGPETLGIGESGTISLSAESRTHPLQSVTWRVEEELRASFFPEDDGFWSQEVRFAQPGTYTVSAAVRDESGLSTVATHTVTVAPTQRIETTVDTDQIGTRSGLLVNETAGYPITTTAYAGNGTGRNVTGATSYTLTSGSGVATIETRAGLPVLVPTGYPTGGQQSVTVRAVYNPPGNRSFTATTSEPLFDPIRNLSVTLETDTVGGDEVLVANRSGYEVTTTATYVGGAGTDTVTARAEHAIVGPDSDVARLRTGGDIGRLGIGGARADDGDEGSAGVALDPLESTAPGDPLELQASYPLAGVQYAHTATGSAPIVGLAAQNLSVEIAADRIGVDETTTATATLGVGYVHEQRDGLVETRALGEAVSGPVDGVLSTSDAIAARTSNGTIEVEGREYGTGWLRATVDENDSALASTTLTGSDTVDVAFDDVADDPVLVGAPGRPGESLRDVSAGSSFQVFAQTEYPMQVYAVYPYNSTAFENETQFRETFREAFDSTEIPALSAVDNPTAERWHYASGDLRGLLFNNYPDSAVDHDITSGERAHGAGFPYSDAVMEGYAVRLTGQNATLNVSEDVRITNRSVANLTPSQHSLAVAGRQCRLACGPDADLTTDVNTTRNDLTTEISEADTKFNIELAKFDGDPLNVANGTITGSYPLAVPGAPVEGLATVEASRVYNNINVNKGGLKTNPLGQLLNIFALAFSSPPEVDKDGTTVQVEQGEDVKITAYTNVPAAQRYNTGEKLDCYSTPAFDGPPCWGDRSEDAYRVPFYGTDFLTTADQDIFLSEGRPGVPNHHWKGTIRTSGNTGYYETGSIDLDAGETFRFEKPKVSTRDADVLVSSNWNIVVKGTDENEGGPG